MPSARASSRSYAAPMRRHRIAVIGGDGVGPEVIAEGLRVLEAACVGECTLEWNELAWGSDLYASTGALMPPDGLRVLEGHDAVYLGAVGTPAVPDHVTLWGLLLPIRQAFDLYLNIRPIRLLPGVATPLAGRVPADIDMVCVRENTEGEYAGAGGRVHVGMGHEVGLQVDVFTRAGVERVIRYAFGLARSRRGRLASITKSNASPHHFVMWDEIADRVHADFPDVELDRILVDAACAYMVSQPQRFDVLVASNLFGDILTDLGAAIQGGMGMAASANVSPDGAGPGLFEPVHGSAPDIAGRSLANPIGAVWAGALMLDHLGEAAASARVMTAIETVLAGGEVRTADLGGAASTREVGDALARAARTPAAQ
jgi:tartrate dehydrogenase/decarboxylase / D-malate dehydrogenase